MVSVAELDDARRLVRVDVYDPERQLDAAFARFDALRFSVGRRRS
jgi:hypothetical protein